LIDLQEWDCKAGATLLIPSGNQGNHLYVILNDPQDFEGYQPQSCISVCLCTIRNGPYDKTCVISTGSHSFVVSDSYIAYRHARLDPASHLLQLVERQIFIPLEPFDDEPFEKIRSGLLDSAQTPNYLKQLMNM